MGSGRGKERGALRTAAIFAWRLGGMRVAAGALMLVAICDGGGRRTGAGATDALIGDDDEELAGAADVSIERKGRSTVQYSTGLGGGGSGKKREYNGGRSKVRGCNKAAAQQRRAASEGPRQSSAAVIYNI